VKNKLSRKAEEDLEEIWLYTLEKWSKEQADRYLNLIFDEIEFLPLTRKLDKIVITSEKIIVTQK
jgi:plasmid stabilization system protein ParE